MMPLPRSTLFFFCLALWVPVSLAGELHAYPGDVEARQLQLNDLSGNVHSLRDYRGKLVLVNFWASWCRPCLAEIPGMLRLEEDLQDRGFKILAVNFEESKSKVWRFTSMLGLDFVTLLDPGGETSRAWDVEFLPTSYIIGPEGNIRYQVRGVLDWDDPETRSLIESLLPGQPPAHAVETAAVQLKP